MTRARAIVSLAVLLTALALGPSHGYAKGKDHFFIYKLEFAAADAGDKDLSRGIYLFQVWGGDTFLELQRITLNECSNTEGQQPSVSPRVDIWSTTSPLRLKAVKASDNRVELSLYQAFHHGLPATMTLTFDPNSRPFTKLIELKTHGFIDLRYFPQEIRYIDYVPVETTRLKSRTVPSIFAGCHLTIGSSDRGR
jgi:hypothetical protein